MSENSIIIKGARQNNLKNFKKKEEMRYNKLFEDVKENWPILAGGGASLLAGAVLLFDDVSDFGKLDRVHHYFGGILLIIGGALILGLTLARVILRLFGAD